MTEERSQDNRSLGRRLLAAALVVVLGAAVPVARCFNCGDLATGDVEPREPGLVTGFIGQQPPAWARTSEGLRYLPADVVEHLKRPVADKLALTDEYLFARPERFGMLPDPAGGPFPLGVTVSDEPGFVPMVGITCGACHVGAVSNGKQWKLVPGAPNLMTVNIFFGDMIRSLGATLTNPVELDNLWKAYAAENGLDAEVDAGAPIAALTEQQLADLANESRTVSSVLNDAYPAPEELDSRAKLSAYLVARLVELMDRTKGASGSGAVVLGTSDPWTSTRNLFGANYAHADVSVQAGGPITAPDIYRYRERKWVFWAQTTNSMMERNLAQGLALLGDIDWKTMSTSLDDRGLIDIQNDNETIQPPTWPADLLGVVNQTQASRGCQVFKKTCAGCHEYQHPTERGVLEFGLYDVGTDGEYCKGVNTGAGSYASVPDLVRPVAALVKLRVFGTSASPSEEGRLPVVWRAMQCNKFPARSLEGIWATAPYLHNGSVRTLDELLQPVAQRAPTFRVGSIQYDPEKLGYVSSILPFTTVVDTTVKGMSNAGHVYVISDATERRALVEYLKVHVDGQTCR